MAYSPNSRSGVIITTGTAPITPATTRITFSWWFPYTKSLSKSVKTSCGKVGIQVHFRGDNTIKSLHIVPKDKDIITQKSGMMYSYKCERLKCDEEYIREFARTFGEWFREHLRTASTMYDHANTSGHLTKLGNFSIVVRESHTTTRTIKEAMLIRLNDPSLNRNIGKFQLPYIWDEVLLNTPGLHLKQTLFTYNQVHCARPTLSSPLAAQGSPHTVHFTICGR